MKTLQGTVVSDVNDKTIIVNVVTSKNHPLYKKRYSTNKKYAAHDEKNSAKVGDIVIIAETRPLSKSKSWKLEKIVGSEVLKHEDTDTVEEVAS